MIPPTCTSGTLTCTTNFEHPHGNWSQSARVKSHCIPNTTPFGGKAKKGRGVFSLTPQPAGFLKIIVFFLGLCKGLGLCLPIIYNRIKEIDMTFFLLLVGACLVGLVGAEVMNAQ